MLKLIQKIRHSSGSGEKGVMMKRKIIYVMLCLMLCIAFIPAAAFADSAPVVLGDLDLASEDHSGKTLDKDGYEWDKDTNTLTMQDLTVTGKIILPKKDCRINVEGACSAAKVTRDDSGASQATLVKGKKGATFKAAFEVAGNLTFTDLTMTGDEVRNTSVGFENVVMKLENSDITLTDLSWMTNGGIDLVNSTLTVNDDGAVGQFWTEKISMDRESVIESFRTLGNYGNVGLEDGFGAVQDYISVPEGGSFVKETAGREIRIVNADGNEASHFVLKAPEEKCQIDLEASPAEGGTVSGAGEYDAKSTAEVKAEANKGYHFVRWENWKGEELSRDATYSFTVKETETLTAVFAKDSVTPAGPGGTDQSADKGGAAPKTGDDSHAAVWALLMAVSVLGIAGVVFGRKRTAQKR